MKRIVNGVTYNTDTSTALAKWTFTDEPKRTEATLYQTRLGAFFLDEEETVMVWNQREEEHRERRTRSFRPLNAEEAHKWIMEGDTEILHNPFEDPPEAAGEAEPGATIYIRVPASLKRRVDESSKAEKVSGNVWAMRCVEKCLDPPTRELAILLAILKPLINSNSREGQLISHSQKDDALKEVSTWIIALANKVAGPMTIEEIEGKHESDERVKQMRARFAPLDVTIRRR